jgi:hypothetical protein
MFLSSNRLSPSSAFSAEQQTIERPAVNIYSLRYSALRTSSLLNFTPIIMAADTAAISQLLQASLDPRQNKQGTVFKFSTSSASTVRH